MREQVEGLIIDEMRLMAAHETVTSAAYMSALPAALRSESALVRADMERMRAGGVVPHIGASASFPSLPRADAVVGEWAAAVSAAEVAVEALSTRGINVELAAKYGVDAWKEAAAGLDAMVAGARGAAASAAGSAAAAASSRAAAVAPIAARLGALSKRYSAASEAALRTEEAVAEAEREAKRPRPTP